LEVRALSTGGKQQGVCQHNERLIVTIIHCHRAIPANDLEKQASLSPLTVSFPMRLASDGVF